MRLFISEGTVQLLFIPHTRVQINVSSNLSQGMLGHVVHNSLVVRRRNLDGFGLTRHCSRTKTWMFVYLFNYSRKKSCVSLLIPFFWRLHSYVYNEGHRMWKVEVHWKGQGWVGGDNDTTAKIHSFEIALMSTISKTANEQIKHVLWFIKSFT